LAGLVLAAAACGAGQEISGEQSLTLQLLVPADAVVEIDGNPTTSPGELRRYVTPPLRTGKEYSYTLKVTSGGKSVTRQVRVSHAADNTFDLRDDFRAGTAAPAVGPRATGPGEVVGKSLSVKGMMLHRTENPPEWWKAVWQTLDDKADIAAEDLLLGAAGAEIESKDGGVKLTLMSDFGSPLPVLEPAVVLHANPNVDLDFTLDRGRVDITNTKKAGAARVHIRCWGSTWEATLAAPGARLAAEVIGRWRPGSQFTTTPGLKDVPSADMVFLVLSGEVDLVHQGTHHLLTAPPGPAQIGWNNFAGMDASPQALKKLPEWATPLQDEGAKERLKSRLETRDYFIKGLASKPVGEVIDDLLASEDPWRRRVAVILMGATDDLGRLGKALQEEKHRDVWDNAVLVLRHWLGRAPGQDQRFYKGLLEVRKYTPVQAETLIEFLHGFSETDRERPETYEMLIDYLADDRLSIRGLAYWHLIRLVPEGKKIPYDPVAPKEAREKARQEWKKLIPPGKLPPAEKGKK
jgi:uncharacterized protein (TIGR03000 family)